MPRIFISYRRDDTAPHAGRLHDDLRDHFGPDQVFMDVDNIPAGMDFVQVIQDAVGNCDVLLALIGRRWLTSRDSRRALRLSDPNDFVRLEIAAALDRNIRVVPILLDGAPMPRAEDLPEALRPLSRRQALELDNARWRTDVGRLVATFGASTPPRPPQEESVERPMDAAETEVERRLAARWTDALAHYYTGRWREAADALRAIVAERPSYRDAAAKLEEAIRQSRLAERYTAGERALADKAWDDAVGHLRAVLTDDPSYRDAAGKLAEAERRQQLEHLYSEAQELHRAGAWEAVLQVFDRIHRVDADHPDPDGLLASASERAAAARREQELSALLGQALQRMDAGEWGQAVEALEELHRQDPAYREVEALLTRARQEFEREAERQRTERQLQDDYAAAEEARARDDWAVAVERLEAVVAINPGFRNAAAQLDEARRRKQLADLYADARSARDQERWDAIVDVFERVHALEPAYPDPEGLLPLARQQLTARAREVDLASRYDAAVAYFEAREWGQAIDRLERIQQEAPGYRATDDLLTRARLELARGHAARPSAEADSVSRGAGDAVASAPAADGPSRIERRRPGAPTPTAQAATPRPTAPTEPASAPSGRLADLRIALEPAAAGTESRLQVSFRPAIAVPPDGRIVVELGDGFVARDARLPPLSSSLPPGTSAGVSGTTATITIGPGGLAAGASVRFSPVRFSLIDLVNPLRDGDYSIAVATCDADQHILEADTATVHVTGQQRAPPSNGALWIYAGVGVVVLLVLLVMARAMS